MRIGLAQLDARVGDLAGNTARIRAAVAAAREDGAELIVCPELCVTGYPPRDLLLDPAFVEATEAAVHELARALDGGPPVLVGAPWRAPGVRAPPGHPGLLDAALLLDGGRVAAMQGKRLLPSYDVFLEARWFLPDEASKPLSVAGRQLGALVCEDLWDDGYAVHPARELAAGGASLLASLSASPFRAGILPRRLALARGRGVPLVYVNAAGANDELVFDGGSFVTDASGAPVALLPRFEEAVRVVDLATAAPIEVPAIDPVEELRGAIVCGIRSFARKNGLPGAVLGLSGGVDSALVACLAAEALGPAAVTALALPSRHTDPRSTEAARAIASKLGIRLEVVPIDPLHEAGRTALASLLEGPEGGLTDENLQARVRMIVLMAHLNRRGGLLLNTSNQTELALGYGTLHGDLAGTLSPIGDLSKTEVYALARSEAARRGTIPDFVLERPPSAELRPGQVDPFDYPVVAPLVQALVRGEPPPPDAPAADVERCRRLLRTSEHKRFQAGIVLKLGERSFGTGRLMPVTRRWPPDRTPPR